MPFARSSMRFSIIKNNRRVKGRWFSQRENRMRPDRSHQGFRNRWRNTPSERGRFLLIRWVGCFAYPYSTPWCGHRDGTSRKWHHLKQFWFGRCRCAWNKNWCASRSSVNNRLRFWTNPSHGSIQQRVSRKRRITRCRYSRKVQFDLNRVDEGSFRWLLWVRCGTCPLFNNTWKSTLVKGCLWQFRNWLSRVLKLVGFLWPSLRGKEQEEE